MFILINKRNTAINKKQQRERVNETKQFCKVKTHKTENNYPPTQVGTGYLSMVLNQRQLSIVVSDWEPYLGSLFSHYGLWVVVFRFSVCTIRDCFSFHLFSCSFVFSIQLIKGNMNTYHAALWSTPSSSGEHRYTTWYTLHREYTGGPIPKTLK